MRTLIIGAGLSGLAVANALQAQGRDFVLIEARDRIGGRIMTERFGTGYFDMGPAWFWPGQPRIAALIDRLGLERFEQHAQGDLTFEDAQRHVQRGRGFPSMEGSWRLKDGLQALTQALAGQLSDGRLRLNTPVTVLSRTAEKIAATLSQGETVYADQVVLAMPPRVAMGINLSPALAPLAVDAMRSVPTWMAGHAKALAVYETPFWRTAGLSGDATSRFGPMVEIHDASPAKDGPYGLFGFIGVPAQARVDENQLGQHVVAQLVRLFGSEAATPSKLYLKDWARDPYTATADDQKPLYAHPDYGMPEQLKGLWDGSLVFAGTEVASQFGGYLEGALEAAETAIASLK